MYSQQELDDAVEAGVISTESANALRAHVQGQRSTAIPDEEQFRLITGFNDIFVSIAAAILLFAVGWIGQSIGQSTGLYISDNGDVGPSFLAPLAIAATAWGLALFFTARRRMALPSILLLLAFVGGVLVTSAFVLVQIIGADRFNNNQSDLLGATVGGISAAIAAVAAWIHWLRFQVPITIAAGAAAVAGIFLAIVIAIVQPGDSEAGKNLILGFVLLLGIGVFLFAMWWDSSDRARITRRSDVAFWLHLLAAPMIAHPIFTLMGVNSGAIGTGEGLSWSRSTSFRTDRSSRRSPRPAGFGACLRPFCADGAVQAIWSGRVKCRSDGAHHRFGASPPIGLLAPGAKADCDPASVSGSGASSGARPPRAGHPTSRISRRSSGARTGASSWPRFEHCAMVSKECKRPLLQPERGAFLYADFGPFTVPPVRCEYRRVGIDPERVIAPVARRNHSAIQIQDPLQFPAIEGCNGAPIPARRERRDDAQADFTRGWGWAWRAALRAFNSARSSSSSCSRSLIRTRTGSQSSPQGVP